MFEILVYLYETYYRPEACPDAASLARKLSAVGFEQDDISEAIDWLAVLANQASQERPVVQTSGFRIYAQQEEIALGTQAIGFLHFLESAGLLNAQQREIVIERALAVGESPIAMEQLRIIVLMLLWSQGKEPDMLMLDELLHDDDQFDARLLH